MFTSQKPHTYLEHMKFYQYHHWGGITTVEVSNAASSIPVSADCPAHPGHIQCLVVLLPSPSTPKHNPTAAPPCYSSSNNPSATPHPLRPPHLLDTPSPVFMPLASFCGKHLPCTPLLWLRSNPPPHIPIQSNSLPKCACSLGSICFMRTYTRHHDSPAVATKGILQDVSQHMGTVRDMPA